VGLHVHPGFREAHAHALAQQPHRLDPVAGLERRDHFGGKVPGIGHGG